MKNFLKQLTPPLVINFYRKLFVTKNEAAENIANGVNTWTGDYSSWQEAKDHTTGYDDKEIMEKCKNALLKVKNGEVKYERDSVLFNEIEYSWPLVAALQSCAIENNNMLSVLDFGGSFGSTYFQNKFFLSGLVNINWHIVEQKNFVEEGKKFFEDDTLKFFYTIEESLQHRQANIVILSGVLQYMEKPYEVLANILAFKIPYVIIDRTAFVDNSNDILTVQKVPEEIYKASYPAWFFNINNFLSNFHKNYELIFEFDNSFTSPIIIDGKRFSWKGFFFKIRNE